MNWSILVPILVGFASLLLGFFLGKRFSGNNHDDCNDRIQRLENSLEASKEAKFKLDKELKSLKQLI